MASEPATPRQIGLLYGLYGAALEKYLAPESKAAADLELRRLTGVKDARALSAQRRTTQAKKHRSPPATKKQIALLRDLCAAQRQRFVMPSSIAEASHWITLMGGSTTGPRRTGWRGPLPAGSSQGASRPRSGS